MIEGNNMGNYTYKQIDFDHPPFLFVLEDKPKNILGGPLLYNPYFKTFGLNGSERVLDFGCGGGAGSRCLAKLLNSSGHLTCVDISDYWITRAKHTLKKCTRVECMAGNIRELDILENSFDIISIIHVSHDIPPKDRQSIVDRLSKLLTLEGKIFLREPIKESHGIPIREIQSLLLNSGLTEVTSESGKSEYKGVYTYS